jgi:hypothetical protein
VFIHFDDLKDDQVGLAFMDQSSFNRHSFSLKIADFEESIEITGFED